MLPALTPMEEEQGTKVVKVVVMVSVPTWVDLSQELTKSFSTRQQRAYVTVDVMPGEVMVVVETGEVVLEGPLPPVPVPDPVPVAPRTLRPLPVGAGMVGKPEPPVMPEAW